MLCNVFVSLNRRQNMSSNNIFSVLFFFFDSMFHFAFRIRNGSKHMEIFFCIYFEVFFLLLFSLELEITHRKENNTDLVRDLSMKTCQIVRARNIFFLRRHNVVVVIVVYGRVGHVVVVHFSFTNTFNSGDCRCHSTNTLNRMRFVCLLMRDSAKSEWKSYQKQILQIFVW